MDRDWYKMKCRHCSYEKLVPFYDSMACMEVDGCNEANYAAFVDRTNARCPVCRKQGFHLDWCKLVNSGNHCD